MNTLLRSEIALLERTTLSKVTLETDLAGDLWPIRGDPAALSNALMNLCVNAVDAMPGKGTLLLRTRNLSREDAAAQAAGRGGGRGRRRCGRSGGGGRGSRFRRRG